MNQIPLLVGIVHERLRVALRFVVHRLIVALEVQHRRIQYGCDSVPNDLEICIDDGNVRLLLAGFSTLVLLQSLLLRSNSRQR